MCEPHTVVFDTDEMPTSSAMVTSGWPLLVPGLTARMSDDKMCQTPDRACTPTSTPRTFDENIWTSRFELMAVSQSAYVTPRISALWNKIWSALFSDTPANVKLELNVPGSLV